MFTDTLGVRAPAATVFGPQLYLAEQLGFRKIIDCAFMITTIVRDGVDR